MLKTMKKNLSILLAVVLIFGLLPIRGLASDEVWDGVMPAADEAATYSGGLGTASEPFLISTAADLAQLSVNTKELYDYSVDKYFLQTADIALNTADVFVRDEFGLITGAREEGEVNSWQPIGSSLEGYYFSGNYDGGGNVVRGIYINSASSKNQGLFGLACFSRIVNIGVEDSCIIGGYFVGAVVGSNHGIVINCYNSGTVSGNENVGGVIGYNGATSVFHRIDTSVFVANSYNTGKVSGYLKVGGVVGCNGVESFKSPLVKLSSTVISCYNSGTVFGGSEYVGGVVGFNAAVSLVQGSAGASATVADSYNIGSVSGEAYVGGAVGFSSSYMLAKVKVENCYYLDTSIIRPINSHGTALSDEEMQQVESFEGLDFERVWAIDAEAEYPYPTLRPYVPADGVLLNKDELVLEVGQREELTAILLPEGAQARVFTWSTSDKSVAGVSDGFVTAYTAGTAIIKVTAEDGGFTAECLVTVTPKDDGGSGEVPDEDMSFIARIQNLFNKIISFLKGMFSWI